MQRSDTSAHHATPPRFPMAMLRALLPWAERDELLADVVGEYGQIVADRGVPSARRWLWWQTARSAPALLRWTWWREWSGFESPANDYRPGGTMLRSWITDVRYAARRLRARPSYSLLAVLTLALGIGGTAAVFGVARPVLFDPLPYANADRLGMFWMPGWWTEEEFLYLRGNFSGFQLVSAHRSGDVTMREGDAPARLLSGLQTSAELFDVLGARPFLGRGFHKGDDAQGAEPVVVLSYGLWKELGGNASILGRRITLDELPRTVVGVMPAGFWFPDPSVRIWIAKPFDPEGRNGSYAFVGLAAPGVAVHNMPMQLDRLTKVIGGRFKYSVKADKTQNAVITPLREQMLGAMRPALVATFVVMGLILLIACVNVAALMLGQVEGRSTELAIRSALGASRRRITQQLVVEALLVGLAAGVCGAALAAAAFRVLARALPLGAWSERASPDWTVLVAALGIALFTALLVVLIPLISLWRSELRGTLNRARTGGIQGRGGRMERGLVVVEVALAMLIATGAALLVRSVSNLYAINPGIETSGVGVVDVMSSRQMKDAEHGQALERILAALAVLPGVQRAAATSKLPLRGDGDSFDITVEGKPELASTFTYFRFVSPSFFETLGMHLRDGRLFTNADRGVSERVVVINEALAQKYFPGENPIGRRLGGGLPGWVRVVGVVANTAEASLTDEPQSVRYYPAAQVPWWSNEATFVIRTTRPSDAATILDAARRAVNGVAPSFAVQNVTTMSRTLDLAVGPPRQIMSLLAILSGLALVLGGVGIYGVISHFAARRQRDWAIRVALGLPGSRVVTHIVGQGISLVAIGIACGALGAVALARLLASFLFGVSAVDPLAFLAASALLMAIGMIAAFVPARRAGTVDPALVLREQ